MNIELTKEEFEQLIVLYLKDKSSILPSIRPTSKLDESDESKPTLFNRLIRTIRNSGVASSINSLSYETDSTVKLKYNQFKQIDTKEKIRISM